MMSSSPRKRRTIAWSSRLLGGVALAAAVIPSCRGSRDTLVTFFDGEHGVTLRYPASWKTQPGEPGTPAYRHFVAPQAADRQAGVTVTLVAAPMGGSVDGYAKSYLEGKKLSGSKDEIRQGARGRSYDFLSGDGATRYMLILLQDADYVYGLYAQGPAKSWEEQEATVRESLASLTLERPAAYVEQKNDPFGFSVRVPPSWKSIRSLSNKGSLMMQFASPPLAVDREKSTLHATLTVSIKHLPDGGNLKGYYEGMRQELGDAFTILEHTPLKGGYVDVLRSETPVAVQRRKQYFQVAHGHGYSLIFEARDDVYDLAAPWFDLIASTFIIERPTQ